MDWQDGPGLGKRMIGKLVTKTPVKEACGKIATSGERM